MKPFWKIIWLIICLTGVFPLNIGNAKGVLDLSRIADGFVVGKHLDILEDPDGQLDIGDVSSGADASLFVPSDKNVPNFGFTDSAIWVRLRVANRSDKPGIWLLKNGFDNTHYLDFYSSKPDGGFDATKTGVARPASTRQILYRKLIFRVSLQPREEKLYFFRYENEAALNISITAWTPEGHDLSSFAQDFYFGMFYGVLFIMVWYNLFLYLHLREPLYLYYVLFSSSFIIFQSGYDGIAPLYWPALGLLAWRVEYVPLTFGLGIIGLLKFTSVFLSTRQFTPIIHRMIQFFMAVYTLIIMSIPVAGCRVAAQYQLKALVFVFIIFGVAGIKNLRKGNREAKYYIWAGSCFITGSLITSLALLGFLPFTPLTEYSYQIGAMLLSLLLSLGLADRINKLQIQTEIANTNLIKSEEKFRAIFNNAFQFTGLLESDGTLIKANKTSLELAGLKEEDVIGKKFWELPWWTHSEKEQARIRNAIKDAAAGRFVRFETTHEIKGRDKVTVDFSLKPIKDSNGKVVLLLPEGRDITELNEARLILQRSKEELDDLVKERTEQLTRSNRIIQESEARIRSLLENVPDYIINVDENLNIHYINKSIEDDDPANVIGKTIYDYVTPEHHALITKAVKKTFRTGHTETIEICTNLPGQNSVWFESRFAGIEYDNRIAEVMVISTDITEQRQTKAKLAIAQQDAVEKAHKAGMADIAAGTIHNVGNLLTSLSTSAQILMDTARKSPIIKLENANDLLRSNLDRIEDFILKDPKGMKLFEYYLKIEDNFHADQEDINKHIIRIREKIIEIEKVISAQQKFTATEPLTEIYSLHKIVENALMLKSGVLNENNITIQKSYSKKPSARVQKVKLINILVNLIDNAVDAMDDISKAQRILNITIDIENSDALIRVVDSGHGIEEHNLHLIFNHGFTTRTSKSGFSLHNSANSMTQMNGKITAHNNPAGNGAVFTLKFPAVTDSDS